MNSLAVESVLTELSINKTSLSVKEMSLETDLNESPVKKRPIEIVDQLIDKAKLNRNELKPLVQNIYLAKSIASDDVKLLELDEEKLQYLLDGNCLTIRGTESDNAVCCTSSSTFSFKVAEISNPLLLTSDLKLPNALSNDGDRSVEKVHVSFMTNSYFVLEKEKPKLQKLRNLLEMNFYCGKSVDDNNDALKYTIKDFLDLIQSSEEEILIYLNLIEAYKIDGFWRLLDYKYHSELIDNILKIVEERCWSCDQIPVKEIFDELVSLYSLSLLNQVINYYFSPNDDLNMYQIKKEKICHFYAENLLRSTTKMRYSEFIAILRNSLPNNFNYEFNINDIQDICYVEEPYIYYLNVLDLPDDVEKRFKFLFDKRKKWTYEELKAFMKDLCANDITEINSFVTKYCRPFTQNNIKYFSSRI